jgi:transposase
MMAASSAALMPCRCRWTSRGRSIARRECGSGWAAQLAEFAAENKEWLRIYRLPAYAPELNPAEGIWSLLKRAMANFAAPGLDHLVRIVKRKLKKI